MRRLLKEVPGEPRNFSLSQISKYKGQPFSDAVQFFRKTAIKFPAKKNCHTSNVMFIFLSQNQKKKKQASIKKKITNGSNI